MMDENPYSAAGLMISRQVLGSDPKTTAADLNFLVIALQEARAGRVLAQADQARAVQLYRRALCVALETVQVARRRPFIL